MKFPLIVDISLVPENPWEDFISEGGKKSNRTRVVKGILREVILLNISNNSFIPTTLSENAMSVTPKPAEGQGNTNQGQLTETDDAPSLETHVPFH